MNVASLVFWYRSLFRYVLRATNASTHEVSGVDQLIATAKEASEENYEGHRMMTMVLGLFSSWDPIDLLPSKVQNVYCYRDFVNCITECVVSLSHRKHLLLQNISTLPRSMIQRALP